MRDIIPKTHACHDRAYSITVYKIKDAIHV